MFFPGAGVGKIIIRPGGSTSFSRSTVPSKVLSSTAVIKASRNQSRQRTIQHSQVEQEQHQQQQRLRQQQQHLFSKPTIPESNYRPQIPSVQPSTYPIRPTSREQHAEYFNAPHRPKPSKPSKQTKQTKQFKQSKQSKQFKQSKTRTAARNIDKRSRAKKRAQNAKRRGAYKINAKDGRVTQLVAAQGNAFNARPQSSSSSKSSRSSRSSQSRDTWIPSKVPSSSAYQAPRSTTMDTAFTSMAGTMPSSSSSSSFSSSFSPPSQQHKRRDPRQRRPFKDMVEVQKLTQHQQLLQQRTKTQFKNDIAMVMGLGVRRNDAISWCKNDMDAVLRIVLNHMSIINMHRSRDFMDLQTMLEEQKTTTLFFHRSSPSSSSSSPPPPTVPSSAGTFTTPTTPTATIAPPMSLLMHECREESRIEREETLLVEIQQALRQNTTHEGVDGDEDKGDKGDEGDLENIEQFEDYTPMLVVDLIQALKTQRDRMVSVFRTLSIDQLAMQEKLTKWSTIKIQRQWRLHWNNKLHSSAFTIQQRWANYMCSVLCHRTAISKTRKKWSSIKIQHCWNTYCKYKKSYKTIGTLWKTWLDGLVHNKEYDFYDHDVSRACTTIQSNWRCSVAKKRVENTRQTKFMQQRAKRRKRWEKRRGGHSIQHKRDIYLAHRELVMWHTHLTSEMEHIKREMTREHRSIGRAWVRWENHMRKQIYNKTIPKDWIAQIDTGPDPWKSSTKGGSWNNVLNDKKKVDKDGDISGKDGKVAGKEDDIETQQWLNMKTGEITDVHPHSKEANELSAKESQKCQIILKKRIECLEEYNFKLSRALGEHQSIISQRIVALR